MYAGIVKNMLEIVCQSRKEIKLEELTKNVFIFVPNMVEEK